jgi:glutaredoxin
VTAKRGVEPRVIVYGRAGCHLCADAETLLDRLAAETGLSVVVQNIDADPALLGVYDLVVPVVTLDGVEIGRAPLDAGALRRRLREALVPPPV